MEVRTKKLNLQRKGVESVLLILIILGVQADRGCAAGAFFCWGRRGRLGKKVCNALRATDFREERNPPQADSIVS